MAVSNPMTTEQNIKHPAPYTVHWATGPVHCCEEHARQLRGLAQFLGTHVGVTNAPDGAQCGNCQNEAETAR